MQNNKAPTILQILPSLGSGGVERGTLDMAEAITNQGWRSLVVSSGGPWEHKLKSLGATHITMPVHSKNLIQMRLNAAKLKRLITQREVDLVHARSRAPGWSAYWAAKATGTPFITTFHGTYSHHNVFKRRYNSVMTKGKVVIAPSEHILKHLQSVYKINKRKIRLIPRGVDLSVFDSEKVPPSRVVNLSEGWRLPDGVPLIILPGRVTAVKGHLSLIEALTKLDVPDYLCLFVGSYREDTYFKRIQRALVEYGLTEKVHLVGRTDDMPALYMLGDVIVTPSPKPESFGRTAAEAMAMGRLVVGTDHGGLSEIIADGCGWKVTPNDPAELAVALEEALSVKAKKRESIGKKAKARITKEYSLDQMRDKTLDVYRQVLKI